MTPTHFAIIAISAYLLGSLSFAIIVSKVTLGKDIREYGSGNAGLTNSYRTMGAGKTLFVLLGDIAKGAAAISIGALLAGPVGKLVAGIFVILGHMFPLYFGFRGGKGVASSFAIAWMTFPLGAAITTVAVAIVLAVSKKVSLGSLSGMVVFLLTTVLLRRTDVALMALAFVLTVLVYLRHLDNIRRLLHGEEKQIVN